jgi:hypothetical protein
MHVKPVMSYVKYRVHNAHVWLNKMTYLEPILCMVTEPALCEMPTKLPHPSLQAVLPHLYGSITFTTVVYGRELQYGLPLPVVKKTKEKPYG